MVCPRSLLRKCNLGSVPPSLVVCGYDCPAHSLREATAKRFLRSIIYILYSIVFPGSIGCKVACEEK